MTTEQVTAALDPGVQHVQVVDVVALENTHGRAGGRVMALDDLCALSDIVHEHGVPVHLDGARIFNASVASGVPVAEFCTHADTMMFCVSKGLGAPIGSLVCGEAEAIREARRLKLLFGGGWRQAGIMAAAGLVALEEGPARLHEDHDRARRLATGVAEALPGSIDPSDVETNMVFVDTQPLGVPPREVVGRLGELGIGATFIAGKVRMVTHVGISEGDVETAIAAWRSVASELR